MKVYIFSYTRNGAVISAQMLEYFSKKNISSTAYAKTKYLLPTLENMDSLPENFIESIFKHGHILIFVGAVGIAVRKIAPFVNSKDCDPAVICIDEQSKYVVPVLSGHIGGANAISIEIAKFLKALPIITTATDLQHKFAIDLWAQQNNLAIINPEKIKYISSAVLDEIPIGFISGFQEFSSHSLPVYIDNKSCCGVCISLNIKNQPFAQTLLLSPKYIIVGMGCRKNVEFAIAQQLLLNTLEELQISIKAVKVLASIDLKKSEPSFLQLCEKYDLEFITYSAHELSQVQGEFGASNFVKNTTGVDNVCERSAILAANTFSNGKLILRKKSLSGVTIAIAQMACSKTS